MVVDNGAVKGVGSAVRKKGELVDGISKLYVRVRGLVGR